MTDLLVKVGPAHLSRDAYVYVRQSTLTQVRGAPTSVGRKKDAKKQQDDRSHVWEHLSS